MKCVVVVLAVIFTPLCVFAGGNYNYTQLSSEMVKYSNTPEVSSGIASSYKYSSVNSEEVSNEVIFGVVIIDRYAGTTTPETDSHNFLSFGSVYHPTIGKGVDGIVGGYLTLIGLGFGAGNIVQDEVLEFRFGLRSFQTESLELNAYLDILASQNDTGEGVSVGLNYKLSKNHALQLSYSKPLTLSVDIVGAAYTYYHD